jgi:hypothetical protein
VGTTFGHQAVIWLRQRAKTPTAASPRLPHLAGPDEGGTDEKPRACPDCLPRAWLLTHLAPPEGVRWTSCPSTTRRWPDLHHRGSPATFSPESRRCPSVACETICPPHSAGPAVGTTPAILLAFEPPPMPLGHLTGRGDSVLLDRLVPSSSVAVVGARRASTYGREIARELGSRPGV